MFLFNFKITGSAVDSLRAYSHATGQSMAEYLRRLIDADEAARSAVLSGAVVTGRVVQTTSGELFIHGRF